MPRALTPSDLTVLRLLHERPMHPYEMHRLVRERAIDMFVGVGRGSLYHAVERLERGGLIAAVETGREGRRPERTTYRLTEAGEEALIDRLHELISEPSRDHPRFIAALAFLSRLDPRDTLDQLERRVVWLESEVAGFEAALARLAPRHARVHLIELEYAIALRRAELAWLDGVVEDLRAGRLHWDPAAETHASPPDLRVVEGER